MNNLFHNLKIHVTQVYGVPWVASASLHTIFSPVRAPVSALTSNMFH